MAIAAGTRLGSYEVIGPLGSGGMGDVYRARDTRLNRDVAIKVVPERLAMDPAALSRFEREAQAVAALSHPNILAIHDFGTENGITYAVTELLEGDTLRARLTDGALPTRRAVDYGVHIARGIAAAHERGIIHRDLKPENIFITRDGVVKILDFGLAKANAADARAGNSGSTEPGATAAQTQLAETTPGTVLGTVGYMSPEQVRGQALDHRTDIFSFGAVLYEMLTGRRAFRGDSHVETMNAILKEDPPEFGEVSANLPGSLERIVRRCLEKQPSDRFHSAHDLAISLEALSGASSQSSASVAAAASAPAMPAPRRGLSPVLVAAALVVVGVAGFFAAKMFAGAEPASAPEFKRLTYRRGLISAAHMTPDGATFVYSAAYDRAVNTIYTTRIDGPDSSTLPYDRAVIAAVSPKGELAIIRSRQIITGYANVGTLSRAPLAGGAPRDVLESVQDADWLPDGSSFVVSHFVEGKYRLEWPIGKVVYETTGWVSHPRLSPDGKHVAFLDHPTLGDDRGNAAVIDEAGTKRVLGGNCESTQGLAWAPSGQEVWFTCASGGPASRALMAAPLSGTLRSVLRVPGTMMLGDIAADGSVLIIHSSERRGIIGLAPGETQERDLSWLDWSQPRALSDDGKTLLITEEAEGGGAGYSVYLRKTDGSPAVRLGPGEGLALSADGQWAIAQKVDTDPLQLTLLPTGAGQARSLTSDRIDHADARFLPDGKRFIFRGFEPGKLPRTWVQDLAGGAAKPVTPEGLTGLIVVSGNRVAVRNADGTRKLVAIDGGAEAPVKFLGKDDQIIRLSTDGRTAYLRSVQTAGALQVSKVDLATGARTVLYTISSIREAVPNGGIGQLLLSDDGRAYVYGYGVTQSELFLVKGLR
jgi:Tol biopolymer transport system component